MQRIERRRLILGAICAVLCLVAGFVSDGAGAQEQEAEKEKAAPDIVADQQDIEARLGELQRQLAVVSASATGDGAPLVEQRIRDEINLLERLSSLYQDQHQAERRAVQLAENRQQPGVGFGSLPDHSPPYSVTELDRLLGRFELAQSSRASLESTLQAGLEGRNQAERRQKELASQLSQQRDAVVSSPIDHELRPRSQLELELRIVRQEVELLDQQLANDRLALEQQTEQESELGAAIAEIRGGLQVSEGDLQEGRLRFTAQEEDLRRREKSLRQEVQRLENEAAKAEEAATSTPTDSAAQARLEDVRARLAIATESAVVVDERREWIALMLSTWELRMAFLRGDLSSREQLRGAERHLAEAASHLDLDRRRRRSRLNQLRAEQLENESPGGRFSSRVDERGAMLEQLVEMHQEDLERLSQMSTQFERPLAAIRERLLDVSWRDRLKEGLRGALAVGEIELLNVQDQSITVGAVLGAILLVSLGSWLARRASAIIARRLLVRLRLDVGAVATFQALIFYFLLIVLLVWALKLVNIPLTVFTFLGGALAIGVGFGSQNIVNNFMSGLILMAERPVKVGDLVEIQGTTGHVEHIGPRSTRVRAGNNTHIIVPNSAFLEDSVLNWTLSDNILRTQVDVGVAYGSDLAEVRRQLDRALAESDTVLDDPPYEILFTEFGDNALHFRLLFWTQVRQSLDQVRAQSQVRFKIDALFRQSQITIAFPQRDLHLDSLGPLEVNVRNVDAAVKEKEPGE